MKHLKTLLLILAASLMLVACGSGGGGGSDSGDSGSTGNTGSDPVLLVGTWDLSIDDDGDNVLSGSVILGFTSTHYGVTETDCVESGTYKANGTTVTTTVETANGSECDDVGVTTEHNYTVNATRLTITGSDGGVYTFQKL